MGRSGRRTRLVGGLLSFVLITGMLWALPEVAHATSITVNTAGDPAPDANGECEAELNSPAQAHLALIMTRIRTAVPSAITM